MQCLRTGQVSQHPSSVSDLSSGGQSSAGHVTREQNAVPDWPHRGEINSESFDVHGICVICESFRDSDLTILKWGREREEERERGGWGKQGFRAFSDFFQRLNKRNGWAKQHVHRDQTIQNTNTFNSMHSSYFHGGRRGHRGRMRERERERESDRQKDRLTDLKRLRERDREGVIEYIMH